MMIDGKSTGGTSTSWKDQDGHGMMKSEIFFLKKFRAHVVATHILLHIARAQLHFAHLHACTYTHGSSVFKRVRCMCVIPLHLAFSTLMFHLFLLFLGHAHLRTSTEEFGYLAKSGVHTGYESFYRHLSHACMCTHENVQHVIV